MNPTIAGFIKKELLQAMRDIRMRAVIFVLPAVQMMLFGYALSTEVKNIKLALFAAPGDHLAQKVMQRCYTSGWFLPAPVGENAFEMVKSGKAHAVLISPKEGLAQSLAKNSGEIALLIDGTNVIRARQTESYVKSVVKMVLEDEGMPVAGGPLSLNVRVLYNPSMASAIFMVPGVMCMVLCVVTIILTAMSMSKERELGTFEMLISAPVSNWEILAGKTLPYIILALIDLPIILGVAIFLFDVPMRGNFLVMLIAALVFMCATVSIGTLISTFAKNQQQAMMGGFLFLFPSILLSGLMFPLESMPAIFKPLVYLNPLQYFVTLMRDIMLKGGTTKAVIFNTSCLAILGAMAVTAASLRFKQKLN